MLYLSEVLNTDVQDSSDEIIGKLTDILIKQRAGVYSSVDFILVKDKKNKKINFIPYYLIENFGKGGVILRTRWSNIIEEKVAEDEYLKLNKDILDEQIVDTEGIRIVRVNDLQLGIFQEKMCVLGIDVSFKGLLRRMGIEWIDVFNFFKVYLIDWRKTQPIHGHLKINYLADGLVKLHPADLANIVEKLNLNEGILLLKTLDNDTAGRVLEEIQPEIQKILVKRLGSEEAAEVVAKMSIDEVVDLMQSLSDEEAESIMNRLPPGINSQRVKKMLYYPEDTAGGLMNTEFMSALPESTVEAVVNKIKESSPQYASILFVYIIDKTGCLLGVISLRRLLIAEKYQTMDEIMRNLAKIQVVDINQNIMDVAAKVTKYNLFSIAVVDKTGKMLGIVTVDDLMRFFLPRA